MKNSGFLWHEKKIQVFPVKILPKFSDFINSDDCIRKIKSKSIRLYPGFIQKEI